MFRKPSLALLAIVVVMPNAPLCAQPKYAKEVYQDFRNKAPLRPEFRLEGPDLETVATPEDAGFRVKLPKTRKDTRNVQMAPTFIITGDFEITGAYEIISADLPTDGWGVGVSISLADTFDLHKFLKIGRFMRPNTGSVFMAEYWTKGADDWKGPQLPTNVLSGQLRIVREGTAVRSQVTEGPGQEFVTIFEKADFGAEALPHLRFLVSTGNKPGYGVDARLVDLRVRYGNVGPDKAADDPVAPVPIAPMKAEPGSRLALLLALGLMLTLTLAIMVGLIFYLRRQRSEPTSPDADPDPPPGDAMTIACSACGKILKVKSASAGQRVKCPKCGQAVVVPNQSHSEERITKRHEYRYRHR